jgi:formate dehydrogenase alpha subunit
MAEKKVSLTIDGKGIEVEQGITVLEAAKRAGIYIPTLCADDRLEPYGGCRLCLVEIEKMRGLPPSCTTYVQDGMKVRTNTEEIQKIRKMLIEMLLSDHPYDCLTCTSNLHCELQKLAEEFGIRERRLRPLARESIYDDSNAFFFRDMTKCVLCAKCVRVCMEINGVAAIDISRRGYASVVQPFGDVPLAESICESCGECVEACPTAALSIKKQEWPDKEVPTICPYCGTGCGILLGIKDEKVVSIRGDKDNPTNRGQLCVKGRFGSYEFVGHPDRLKKPLIKRNGEFAEASWEDALDLVAEKLRPYHGADQFAALSSAKCTNEENYMMQKFARAVMRTNNVDHCARLCHASTVAGLAATFGSGAMTNGIDELRDTDLILLTGSNTTENHPVIGYRIREAVRKGAKLIVFDPREIPLTWEAWLWCRQRPGTDVAWINGLIHIILEQGLEDKNFIKQRTEGFEDLKKVVEKYTPDLVSKITGIPEESLYQAARAYAEADSASIVYSMGITQHTTGTDNVKSCANLAMVCGHIGKPGTGVNPLRGQNNVQGACDLGALPNVFPGYQAVSNEELRGKFEKAWGVELPDTPGLTVVEIMNAAAEGKIKALYIMGENPMISDPDISHVEEGLKGLEFLVVQDIFLTETARLADVVLPGVCFAEKDGTFTNTERRVQLLNKAVDPPGEARQDWQIISELAGRLGYHMNYNSSSEIMDEARRLTPQYAGISHDRLKRGHELCWPCPDEDHPGTRILHKDKFTRGKGKFFAIEFIEPDELPDKKYPYTLTTGRILYHFHTGTMTRKSEGLNQIVPGPYAEINPALARRLKVKDGNKIKVSSRRGSIQVKARVTDRVDEGVLFIPFHFVEGAANMITNPALDPQSKIPEFKVCAVKVEKA